MSQLFLPVGQEVEVEEKKKIKIRKESKNRLSICLLGMSFFSLWGPQRLKMLNVHHCYRVYMYTRCWLLTDRWCAEQHMLRTAGKGGDRTHIRPSAALRFALPPVSFYFSWPSRRVRLCAPPRPLAPSSGAAGHGSPCVRPDFYLTP
jgi:hypothetical protein